MPFFYPAPKCVLNNASIAGVQDQLQAFNLMYELGPTGSASFLPDPAAANWRKAIRDGVINCAGDPMEIDFFEKVCGGKVKPVDATNLYIKSNCDIDLNIVANQTVTGSAPGAATNFTLAPGLYTGQGNYANINEGGQIFNYIDEQWLYVSAIDRTTAYAWVITVIPERADYQVNIKAGAKMFFQAVRKVGGQSCEKPASTWQQNGYVKEVSPVIFRKDWELPIDLTRGYQEVLQFAIMFDRDGKEIWSWEYKNKQQMRLEMKIAKNVALFISRTVDNPLLIGAGQALDLKYPAFDGYLSTVKYGGGVVYPYDPAIGFDFNADLDPLILRQDSMKKAKEFIGLCGLPFFMSMTRRNNLNFAESAGGCTFETFKRSGMDMADILKLGVKSINYMGYTLHFKQMDALSDTRFIGNYNFPNTAMLMPSVGLKDSKGNDVAPIEMYMPHGYTENLVYREFEHDGRVTTNQCDTLFGYSTEAVMAATHCPNNHILLQPQASSN